MAAFEVIALDTATPQLRAPGASDTYTFPRAVEMPLGTANGVLYLNGSKVVTSGSGLTFDSSGNLGLGVTPSAWSGLATALQVQRASIITSSASAVDTYFSSNAFYDGNWKYILSGPATQYVQNASGDHRWRVAPSGTAGNTISFTQAMTLNASGNLGIGTTNPTQKLSIDGGASGTVTNVQVGNAATAFQLGVDGSNNCQIRTAQNVSMLFYTNATERARITSGGDFGVGNINPLYRLTVDKDTALALAFFTNSHASAPNGAYIDFSAASPNNATQYFLYCEDSTAQRATIRSNGGLANYQSNNVDLSDARTKKDIAPAPSYWGKIGALEIVTYKYKDQTHDDVNVGVIAQQVEQVEPVWVDSDGFGETPEDGIPLKTVYTKDITFAAIKALQEAMARIEVLEARLAAAGI